MKMSLQEHGTCCKEITVYRRAVAMFVAGCLAGPGIAYGQGHSHAHHGGQVQKLGRFEAELVVRGTDLTLHVLDEQDRPVDTTGYTAAAVVLAQGNAQRTVELRPADANRLAGRVDFPVEGRLRATLTLRNSNGDDLGRARYTPDRVTR